MKVGLLMRSCENIKVINPMRRSGVQQFKKISLYRTLLTSLFFILEQVKRLHGGIEHSQVRREFVMRCFHRTWML